MLPAHDTPAFRELLHQQVEKRRTFAIISHPDAGKTTLTEKLLLYGGAIRSAGSVKARKSDKHATSDWMDIEKQRGISVTSSAMQFEFDGFRINILDTPGHQDFSEDTYRVLVAADAAVMLIDAAKGVEAQTIKLFKVCRMRPRGERPLRADGGTGTGAGHPLLPHQLAHRHGRRFPRRLPPRHKDGRAVYRRRPRQIDGAED